MKQYYKYINDVKTGKIAASQYIKQQVDRLEALKKRDDIYFDEEEVKTCFDFIKLMKHFAGKSAGKQFELLPWQKWVIGSVIGIKYKFTGYRVCRELFIIVSRKNGKSSLIAALSLYMLICDNIASPSIGIVASSRDQARILFEMVQKYSKSIDEKGTMIKNYRNYIKFPANNGEIKVFSSDADSLEGYRFSLGIADETHLYKDNKLVASMRASQGFETEPLLVQITTAGFLTEGYPCFETYKTSIEILAGVKQQDEFFPFLYVMDPEDLDNWTEPSNWIKCNPCLDETVTTDYLKQQVQIAKNDATQEVSIKTKNFNIWCNSMEVWVPAEVVAKQMKEINLEDFRGCIGYMGLDLASVSDLTALSLLVYRDNKYYFWNWGFIPRETFNNSPNAELYKNFYQSGDLIVTEGNVCDYQYVVNKIVELSKIIQIDSVNYDPYNSSQLAIACTEIGIHMVPQRQGLLAFSNPTKEFERLIKCGDAIINKSTMFLWCMNNTTIMTDANFNVKPIKGGTINGKIDPVISAVEAVAGYLNNPVGNDMDFVFIC